MRLIAGIVAFRRAGRRSLRDGVPTELTLREWAARERVATEVVTHYLVPLTSSVWSIEPGRALDMPADTTLRFLDNHGLLGGRPPRWRTVEGGSRSYVDAVRRSLLQRGVDIRTGSTIVRIEREMPAGIVSVTDSAGNVEHYDRVIVAAHSDDALALLADPTDLERDVLGDVAYTSNEVILHDDPTPLPSDPRLWAAWNYRMEDCAAAAGPPRLTYQMNILQHLPARRTLSVTVNPASGEVAPDRILRTRSYSHPRYDLAARAAQQRVPDLHRAGCSDTHTFYCGAWQRWGFHEDGLWSGYAAADALLESLRVGEPLHARRSFA